MTSCVVAALLFFLLRSHLTYVPVRSIVGPQSQRNSLHLTKKTHRTSQRWVKTLPPLPELCYHTVVAKEHTHKDNYNFIFYKTHSKYKGTFPEQAFPEQKHFPEHYRKITGTLPFRD